MIYNYSEEKDKTLTPSSNAQRLLTSCSLWLNTSCRTSITLWRIFSISVTLYINTQTMHTFKTSHLLNTFCLMLKLQILQPRIYITMSLAETSLERGEGRVCLHRAYQPLPAAAGQGASDDPFSFKASPWLDANLNLLAFIGLAADIKTPLQTWSMPLFCFVVITENW